MKKSLIKATATIASLALVSAGVAVPVTLSNAKEAENDTVNTTANDKEESSEEEKLEHILNDEVKQANKNVDKDEVVYVTASNTGATKSIIVSDWLKNPGTNAPIKDASTLEGIVNVKGEETVSGSGTGMEWSNAGNDIYYQGTTEKELPVGMTISYQLDGKNITPESLAGKSGHVTIKFTYTNKEKKVIQVEGKDYTVYTPFTMLSGVILPTDQFSNVEVNSGKILSEGNNQICVGITMPGLAQSLDIETSALVKDLDIPETFEISADVEDFSLGTTMTVCMNGIMTDLELSDVDSLDDLEEQIQTLTDSSDQLSEAAGTISEKTNLLHGYTTKLADGTSYVDANMRKLAGSTGELKNGADNLLSYYEGDGTSSNPGLTPLSKQVADGATALNTSVNGENGLTDALASLGGEAGLSGSLKQLNAKVNGADGAKDVTTLAGGVAALNEGINGSSATSLSNAVTTLQNAVNGTSTDAFTSLSDGTKQLSDGMDSLAAGVTATVSNLDEQIAQATQGATAYKPGYDAFIASNYQDPTYLEAYSNYIKYAAIAATLQQTRATMTTSSADTVCLADAVTVLKAGANGLNAGVNGDAGLANGIRQLYTGINGENGLANGMKILNEGVNGENGLSAGANTLATTVAPKLDQLSASGSALSDACNKLAMGSNGINRIANGMYAGTLTLDGYLATLSEKSNQLQKEGTSVLKSSTVQINDGVNALSDGTKTFHEKLLEFDREGIEKIADLYHGDVKDLINHFKAIEEADKQYQIFTDLADGATGSVKFIIKTEEIKSFE